MAGYTRQDTANNIANGNVIDADDLDSEFNAVEDAFQASTGHNHDGSAGEGAPITKVGPSQDIIVGISTVLPKANNIIDIGSSAAQFKDGYFDGTLYADTVNVGVNGYTTFEDNEYAVSSGDLTVDVAGDIILDADGGDVKLQDGGVDYGRFTNRSNQLSIYSGSVESLRLNGADVDALGTFDVTGNATVGGTFTVTGDTSISSGNLTVNTGDVSIGGTLGVTGTITGTLSGSVTGNVTGDVTGTVSSISNHDTDDLTEGTNLYYTDARARAAISATGSLTYDDNTGVLSFTQGDTDTVAEGLTNLYYTDARVASYISGNRSYGNITSTGNIDASGNLTVQGNLTVSGTTTTVNTETINLADNIITLNSNEAGTPSQNAGIEIERGTSANKQLIWNESTDRWSVGSDTFEAGTIIGNIQGQITGNADTADALSTARNITLTGEVTGSASFDGSADANITATVAADVIGSNELKVTGTGTSTQFLRSDGDGTFTWATPSDTNYYVSSGSFSGTTLTLQRSGLSSISISGFPTQITDNSQIGNGAGYITSAPAPTSSQVGSATAGLSAGDVGTYAFLMRSTSTGSSTVFPNGTYSSSLLYTDRSASNSSSYTTSGTWKCMGYTTNYDRGTVWLRIA